MIDDPEEFAWQQLEAKQNKAKAKPVTERDALKIAYNALIEIDKETPYPLAKHAAMVINEVLSRPVQDWEAISADQAMTIAMLRDDLAQQSKPWVSLSDRNITGAAHTEARYPVSILETTDSGLCMQFSETGEWHASDKRGDFMKVNSFLMSFARAVEAELRSKNA